MKSISHSQFTAYNECNLKWKLRYIDKLSLSGGNIHTLFGSAMHTVLQEYLTTMYNKSIVEAEKLKLDVMLKEQMIKEFNIIRARWKMIPCEQKDMVEFYQDGVEIIKHFKKHRNKYFMKKNYELVGVEVPIFMNIQEGVQLKSFLDVVIRNKVSGRITIIDLKTATRGWWDYQKKDFYKKSQLLMYKQFYSEKFDVSLDKIDVYFLILKRKIAKKSDFPISRLQKFEPAHGKPSVNKTMKAFHEFRELIFDSKGEYRTDRDYAAKPGSACKFCEFYDTEHCEWGKIL
jgi:predicted nucleic-acid-binding Zn-ribbon protein